MPRVSGQSRARRDRAGAISSPATAAGADPVKAQTVRLPSDLWRRLKIRAVDEERPMSEIIRDALEDYLSAPGPAEG
ncbi:ribbon-helix-helix protein, CopG family [Methylobacterium sp. sgz302541]|uniref:ribbon-helix-helix protein, CopG family n=1 Tax=unclassified Methylobacterium TaxID=2615210 RepID=UPI003D348784